jgi:hypothetical protein
MVNPPATVSSISKHFVPGTNLGIRQRWITAKATIANRVNTAPELPVSTSVHKTCGAPVQGDSSIYFDECLLSSPAGRGQPDLSEQLWVEAIAAHLLVTATVVDFQKPSPLIRSTGNSSPASIYYVCPLRSLSTHTAPGWMYSSCTCPSTLMKLTC